MKEINIRDIKISPVELISDGWALLTAGNEEKFNTMTVSWGAVGEIWGKDAVFIFIRPQRYTYEFTEKTEGLTLSFFSEEYRDALKLCGRVSGRDCDKITEAGLTPMLIGERAAFEEARMVMSCRKLYADDIKECAFVDPALLSNYSAKDYHKMYIVEIEGIIKK